MYLNASLLSLANEVCKANVFTGVCPRGRGHACKGVGAGGGVCVTGETAPAPAVGILLECILVYLNVSMRICPD